jgi:hypothetical protein
MEQWDKNYYITALAGANNGSSLVIMSRGNAICSWSRAILVESSNTRFLAFTPYSFFEIPYKIQHLIELCIVKWT